MDLNQLQQKAREAIFYLEDADAKKLVKVIEEFIAGENIASTNPNLFQKLQDLLVKLRIVAFPNLTDEECVFILRYHYLESYDVEVSMENRITGKLFSIPYLARDEIRERMRRALLANEQKIGNFTIGKWLKEFEMKYNVQIREMSSQTRFLIDHSEARLLPPSEKRKLKEIIHTYDSLLVSTVPATGSDLDSMLESMSGRESVTNTPLIAPIRTKRERGMGPYFELETQRKFPPKQSPLAGRVGFEKLTLSEALKKYPNLGEQPISGSPIKIKLFPDPVRPSVKNWIADYHAVLGAGAHGVMERGNYLYHSENAKRLTAGERQKLAIVLKSLDENLPLTIDPNRQEIIFVAGGGIEEPERRDMEEQESPPKMPAKKEYAPKPEEEPGYDGPQPLPGAQVKYNPSRIYPVGYGPSDNAIGPKNNDKDPRIKGNTIDLRNN
jgi:hypothetical protein